MSWGTVRLFNLLNAVSCEPTWLDWAGFLDDAPTEKPAGGDR